MAAISSSPYNLLSSLLNSTRFVLEKIRKQDFPISTSQFAEHTIDFQAFTTPPPMAFPTPTSESFSNSSSHSAPAHTNPGLWSFFTSQYALVIIIITVVMRRLENIVLPSPLSRFTPRQRRHERGLRLWDLPSVALGRILPLNFSSTSTRFALQLPTLVLLLRHLLIWAFLVVQTSGLSISVPPHIVRYVPWNESLARLGQWVEYQEMSTLCWGTFKAICAAFCVEHFVQVLDGLDSGIIWRLLPRNPNNSATNLAGNAMLLYFYSYPSNHTRGPDGMPSRPDVHTIIVIAIPILQLTIFHALAISKRFATHRFFPTAFASMLSLAHFYWALYIQHFNLSHKASPSTSITGPASPKLSTPNFDSTIITSMPSVTHPASASFVTTTLTSIVSGPSPLPDAVQQASAEVLRGSAPYPTIVLLPNVAQSVFIFIIFLTIFLNAVVQLLVRGRIERLFSGLSLGQSLDLFDDEFEQQPEYDASASGSTSGLRAFLSSIPMDQDFSTVILRIGTASLEATGLYGWRNEVAGIAVHPTRTRQLYRSRNSERRFGGVRLGNYGVIGDVVKGGVVKDVKGKRPQSRHKHIQGRSRFEALEGLSNEVQTVNVGERFDVSAAAGENSSRRLSMEVAWCREFARFVKELAGVIVGGVRVLWRSLWRRASGRRRERSKERTPGWIQSPSVGLGPSMRREEEYIEGGEDEEDVYQRFLRGETLSDEDEDSDYEEDSDGTVEASRHTTPAPFSVDTEGEDEPEPPSLLTDVLTGSWFGRGRTPAPSRGATPTPSSYRPRTVEQQDVAASSKVMLAHMFYDGGRLTRRRYSNFTQALSILSPDPDSLATEGGDDEDDGYLNFSPGSSRQSSRQATPFNEYDTGMGEGEGGRGREMCVICTVDPREIICWPCRCLAMCDGCRLKLAERSGGSRSGHRCPCCRQIVEGFSRIYVP